MPTFCLVWERVEREIKVFSLHATWVTRVESLKRHSKKKPHPGDSSAVLLKESTRPLKYLQAQFLSPWKFHSCGVWYVIQQNKIFPVNVLNMFGTSQLVQKGQQQARMRQPASQTAPVLHLPIENCWKLQPLHLLLSQGVGGRGRKLLGSWSLQPCALCALLHVTGKGAAAALQSRGFVPWSRDKRGVSSSCGLWFISFPSRRWSFPP